ncbi:MAG TPA: SLC13 family permease [Bacteroidales bacterium]|nr:SLC13 family permease [Bacteroidales bacterium]
MESEIITVLIILALTVLMLTFELVRIDLVAMLCMLSLAWTGLLTPAEALSGFSSNAVIAMMSVMIMGRGIAKTGIMDRFSHYVMRKAGTSRSKLIGSISVSVGLLSGFIQNIGAAALFLPGILNISRRSKISASALIMPMGFAAILGGTITMVGSGPLILINDLLRNASLEPYNLFSVTPAGIGLLSAGIIYFLTVGKFVLPETKSTDSLNDQEKMIKALSLPHKILNYKIPSGSSLAGKCAEELKIWDSYRVNILGISRGRELHYAPWRETKFEADQEMVILGEDDEIKRFARDYGLIRMEQEGRLYNLHDPGRSGFAEVIIPARSELAGQTIRKYSLRKRHEVEPVMLFSRGEEIKGNFSDHKIVAGDTIIVYGLWDKINDMKSGLDFVVATQFKADGKKESKTVIALICFVSAIALAFSGFPISIAFLTGATGMILTRVIKIGEAYQSIEWKVVFLLAGLIPLGMAMQKTGAAILIAQNVLNMVLGKNIIILLLSVAVLSTLFSLFMTNVGSIVVLAPLVISLGELGGFDPRPLALMAAVCAANSFILPTHQVNAFLMTSGGYKNSDYFRAGGGMTLIFLSVVVMIFYLFYI